MAVAAIDCGTNSLRLLIVDGGVSLVRELRIVRLGHGLDATGRLDPAAIERVRLVLGEFRLLMDSHRVEHWRMVATSATRDAANADDFQEMVRGVLGREAEVISGEQEAALAFAGAVAGLPGGREYLVVDIGGGSTELVRGKGSVERSVSMNIGTVRIIERYLHDDPPTPVQVVAATEDIGATVRKALHAIGNEPATLVGVAGAVTTVAAVALAPQSDLHHVLLSAAAIEEVTTMLCSMTRAQRAQIKAIHPGRVDVIMGGALVLREVVRQTDTRHIVVSETDLLDGLASQIQPHDGIA